MGHSGGESNPGESTRRRRRVDATIGHSGGESNPGKGSMGRRESRRGGGRGSMRRRVDESSRAACGFALFFTF